MKIIMNMKKKRHHLYTFDIPLIIEGVKAKDEKDAIGRIRNFLHKHRPNWRVVIK